MTHIGRKFVPSSTIRDRMDRQDLRYEAAARAKVREHAEALGKEPDQGSWNQLAAELERTRYRPAVEVHACVDQPCDQPGTHYYGRDEFDGAGMRFIPHAYRCLAHAEAYRQAHMVIERT